MRTMRVHLSTGVTLNETDGSEICRSSDLDIVGCADKVDRLDSSIGNETGSVCSSSTVGDGWARGGAVV